MVLSEPLSLVGGVKSPAHETLHWVEVQALELCSNSEAVI